MRRVEPLDPPLRARVGEPIVHRCPRAEQLVPQLDRFRNVGAALQSELEDQFLEIDHLQHFEYTLLQLLRIAAPAAA